MKKSPAVLDEMKIFYPGKDTLLKNNSTCNNIITNENQ